MAIEPSIEAKIAEVGRDPVAIRRIVAKDRDGCPLLFFEQRRSLDGFGDVEGKFVVATFVRPDQGGSHPKRGGLARTLEMQDGSSIDERVAHGEPRTVPPLATKVRRVRVARIVSVETVGQSGGLPRAAVFRAPNIIDAADRALAELPAGIQPFC